ncbi:hypothetical protein AOR13_1681 [Alteromonas stellipolaris LMG 21856]|nr:hypothetical protein AOR13_1681 [Alteromonas stellipolaris LMG 21856]
MHGWRDLNGKKGQEADPLTANPESIEFATTQLRELMR